MTRRILLATVALFALIATPLTLTACMDAKAAAPSGDYTGHRGAHYFASTLTVDGVLDVNASITVDPSAVSVTPAAATGSVLDVDTVTITDSATAESGTATSFAAYSLAAPTLAASNATVTTTDAATVYINAAPSAGTNQTLTNAWALWIDAGAVRFDGNVDMQSTGNVGSCTLDGASPSVCTATVLAGSKCTCSPVGATAAIAAAGCAVGLSGTTLTITSANSATNDVNFHCF